MNIISENVKNYLYLAKDSMYNDEMYKLCFERLQAGQHILLLTLTRSRYDIMPLKQNFNISKELLTHFIIMYFPTVESLTRKLLELWTLQPDLVIVDLGQPTPTLSPPALHESLVEMSEPPLLQSLCFCIASLFSFMESVRRKLTQSKTTRKRESSGTAANPTIASLVVLPEQNKDFLLVSQIELLINLYFYKENAFNDFAEFKAKLITDYSIN